MSLSYQVKMFWVFNYLCLFISNNVMLNVYWKIYFHFWILSLLALDPLLSGKRPCTSFVYHAGMTIFLQIYETTSLYDVSMEEDVIDDNSDARIENTVWVYTKSAERTMFSDILDLKESRCLRIISRRICP